MTITHDARPAQGAADPKRTTDEFDVLGAPRFVPDLPRPPVA